MEQEYKYMVCTRCFTYNHAPYIVDAMNGFAMQETTFPVVTLIVDDASTDGEPEVIRQYLIEHFQEPFRIEETEYAHIICAHHKTNPNCQFVVFLLKYNHYSIKKSKLPYLSEWLDNSKYHALCEGDDYWIDSCKLQKQVEYMGSHPNFGMCFTNFDILYEDGKSVAKSLLTSHPKLYPHSFTLEEWILHMGYVGPMTWLVKREIYEKKPKIQTVDGTFVMFASFLANTEVGCLLNETTSVYRRLNESASHSKSYINQYKFAKGLKDVQTSLVDYYHEIIENPKELIQKIAHRYYYNKRFLVLCAIDGDRDELKNAAESTSGLFQLFLYHFSRNNILRFLLGKVYKILRNFHWFFYKRRLLQ